MSLSVHHRITNHRIIWVGQGLKDHLVPNPHYHRLEHLPSSPWLSCSWSIHCPAWIDGRGCPNPCAAPCTWFSLTSWGSNSLHFLSRSLWMVSHPPRVSVHGSFCLKCNFKGTEIVQEEGLDLISIFDRKEEAVRFSKVKTFHCNNFLNTKICHFQIW